MIYPKPRCELCGDAIDDLSEEYRKRHQGLSVKVHGEGFCVKNPKAPERVAEFPLMPLENDARFAVETLLQYIGRDPKSDALKDTPKRVVKALKEMTVGYQQNPTEILGRVFEDNCDEMVILKRIPFTSICEHHLLVFSGEATIGYIPSDGKVVGLSKLARLVDCYAMRLQLQERLTREIAKAIEDNLHPLGVGVIIKAEHSCMACRGIKKAGAQMVTSVTLGMIRSEPAARAEFLKLAE